MDRLLGNALLTGFFKGIAMGSTVFQDYDQNNPIVSSWLNPVNNNTYTPGGVAKVAIQSAAAFVRFSVVGGVVTIQQSVNVSTVTRSSTGVYVITYNTALTQVTNAYGFSMDQPGFVFRVAEALNAVQIQTTNPANTSFDPGSVSVLVFGAN